MKIYLFRLSLTEREQPSLFGDKKPQSRQSFLREHLSRSFEFNYWGEQMVRYEFTQEDDEVLSGAVCKWVSEDQEADPSDPFAKSEGGRWLKASFFFNIEKHQQVFGIEHNTRVGAPSAILAGIARYINELTDEYPYCIEVAEINEKGSFLKAVKDYPHPVTTLSFQFVVPNPPNVEEETREALKKLGKSTGAEEAIETLKSSKGIKVNSGYVNDAVEYIEGGGGRVVAKNGRDIIFDSKNRVRTETPPEEARPKGKPIAGLANMVKALLRK